MSELTKQTGCEYMKCEHFVRDSGGEKCTYPYPYCKYRGDDKDAEIARLTRQLADQGNELDTLRRVVWHLECGTWPDTWSMHEKTAKDNGLDIAKMQKEMGK